MLLAGSDGVASSPWLTRTSPVTGANSLTSYGSLPECNAGLMTNTVSAPTIIMWPSGAALPTMDAPMAWLAPLRFTTIRHPNRASAILTMAGSSFDLQVRRLDDLCPSGRILAEIVGERVERSRHRLHHQPFEEFFV